MKNSRVVLVSTRRYSTEQNEVILSLLDRRYVLFCVVGVDCKKIEDIIDELAIGDSITPKFITTTSHPAESVDDVINFAKMLTLDSKSDIDVLII